MSNENVRRIVQDCETERCVYVQGNFLELMSHEDVSFIACINASLLVKYYYWK